MLTGTLISYTTRNTIYIQVVLLAVNGVALLIILWFLPESPKFLYASGQFEQCRDVLCKIARFNNYENNGNQIFRELTYSKFQTETLESSQHDTGSTVDLMDKNS